MKRVHLIGLLLVCLSPVVGACAPAATPVPPTPTPAAPKVEVIKIGGLYPLTGVDALNGETYKKIHDYVVEEINAAGGIKSLGGAKLQMVYGDTQSKSEVGVSEMERLITQEKVVAVVGCFHSHVALPASEVSERYGVPFLVANALAGAITERGLKYVFQTIPTLEQWAADDAKFAAEMGAKTGVITVMNIAFGEETQKAWEAGLKAHNIQILDSFTYQFGATDLTDTILKVKSLDPDVWFLLANTQDAILFTRQMEELNYYPKMGIINLGGGMADPTYMGTVGAKAAEGIFMTGDWFPYINLPGGKEISDAFKAKVGFGLGGVSQTYATMWLLADALEKAGSTDPKVLAEVLRTTTFKEGKWKFQWPEVSFLPDGKLKQALTVIAQYQNGEQRVVWPKELKVADPIWPAPRWDER